MSNVIPFPTRESRIKELEDLLIDVTLDISLETYRMIDLIAGEPDINLVLRYQESTKQDMLLIHEAIKSCLFRMYGKEHALQETANSLSLESVREIKFRDEYEDEDE